MAKILTIIPKQGFELIRDRIAIILFDELTNQSILTGDEDLSPKVFVERLISFDKTDLPAIDVSLAKGDFGNKNQRSREGEYTFNIDVYANAKSNATNDGDKIAAIKAQKIIGVCLCILESSVYNTLGFTPPFILSTSATNLTMADPTDKTAQTDTLFTRMGRISFIVRASENPYVGTANLIDGYETKYTIDNGQVGNLWE